MDDDTDRLANSMDDIADPTSSSSAAMSSSSEEDSVGDSVRRRVCSERGRGGRCGRGVGRGRGRGVGRGRGRGRGRGGGRGRGRGRDGGTNISPQDLKILMGPGKRRNVIPSLTSIPGVSMALLHLLPVDQPRMRFVGFSLMNCGIY